MRKTTSKKQQRSMPRTSSTGARFRRLHPHRAPPTSHETSSPSTAVSNRAKRKRSDADDCENSSKKHKHHDRSFLDVVDGFHAIVASAQRSSSAHAVFAEVFEWIGDAVIGELVGRCLLSQFHHAPLSARVFRNLRLAVVTNRNLAHVYDAMGYARRHSVNRTTDVRKKRKERADVVEAIVGELVVRLTRQRSDAQACALYRDHLDALVAATLRAHFADRTRARELGASAGPLSVSINPFACLPEETLDDATGELVVVAGSFDDSSDVVDSAPSDVARKSFADLLDEYSDAEAPSTRHHAFADVSPSDDVPRTSVTTRTRAAMMQVNSDHVLRTSREVFEVFKVYGMTVLAERVSLALALPHVTETRALSVTPAALTHERQRVLSVAHLAACSSRLGIAMAPALHVVDDRVGADEDAVDLDALQRADERLRANTLRAFVGFHSAVATTSSAAKARSSALVNDICAFLRSEALADETAVAIPDREPLVALLRSVAEATAFMRSATCDALHLPGERPVATAATRSSPERSAFLLRQCDSEHVEDLFETLAREQLLAQRRAAAETLKQQQQTRKKPKTKAPDASQTKALAPNLVRFQHRRFLFCLEDVVVLFATRQTDACRARIASYARELEPCADAAGFRKWDVSTSTLTLAMRDSFYRLLLHDVCQFHCVASSSKNTRDGTRITQLRLPLHYSWTKMVDRRITTEADATS